MFYLVSEAGMVFPSRRCGGWLLRCVTTQPRTLELFKRIMRAPAGRGRSAGNRSASRGFGRGSSGRGRGFIADTTPDTVEEIGELMHECEGELVLSLTNKKIPYFNGPIFLESKALIGRVEEIFGTINEVKFTVKLSDGVKASSYKKGDKFYISPDKLLPIERFTQPAMQRGNTGRGTARGAGRGGRGARTAGRGGAGGRGRGRGGRFSGRGRA